MRTCDKNKSYSSTLWSSSNNSSNRTDNNSSKCNNDTLTYNNRKPSYNNKSINNNKMRICETNNNTCSSKNNNKNKNNSNLPRCFWRCTKSVAYFLAVGYILHWENLLRSAISFKRFVSCLLYIYYIIFALILKYFNCSTKLYYCFTRLIFDLLLWLRNEETKNSKLYREGNIS